MNIRNTSKFYRYVSMKMKHKKIPSKCRKSVMIKKDIIRRKFLQSILSMNNKIIIPMISKSFPIMGSFSGYGIFGRVYFAYEYDIHEIMIDMIDRIFLPLGSPFVWFGIIYGLVIGLKLKQIFDTRFRKEEHI